MLKHTGFLFVILITCGLLFAVRHWPGGLHMTFSQHVARSRSATLYYVALFTITLPLLYVFLVQWFAPTYELPMWFVVFATTSITTQFLCTLVPETGGNRTIVHRILTGVSGVTLLPIMILIAVSSNIPASGRIFAAISLAGMAVLLAIALRNQRGYPYALLLQVGYYALFFASILFITYL